MYAVIETGGKQYRVEVGTELEIELLKADPGETVAFDRVLLIADGETAAIGTPVVANGSVAGEIVRRDRGEKLISFKYRPKARSRVKKGHRQELMIVRISDIVLDGKSAAKEVAQADAARRTERQKLEDAARRQAEQDAALAAKLAADKPATKSKPSTRAKAADTTEVADNHTADDTKPATKAGSAKSTTAKASPTKSSAKADTTDAAAKKAPAKRKTEG